MYCIQYVSRRLMPYPRRINRYYRIGTVEFLPVVIGRSFGHALGFRTADEFMTGMLLVWRVGVLGFSSPPEQNDSDYQN